MDRIGISVALFFASLIAWCPVSQAQSTFYQGKTIKTVVGYLAGDGFDIWARIVSAHMGKHLPSNPEFIVQNMPGASSRIAVNYIYRVAKPDGLTIGAIGGSLYLDQLQGRKEVQFDWSKFSWLGSTDRIEWLFYMRSDSPYKTFEDIRKASEPPKCSTTGTGTSGHFVPRLLEETLKLKINLVAGYQGGSEQDLALERGEVQCRALSVPTFLSRESFLTWRKNGFVRILLQTGQKRDPRLPDVPTLYELMDEAKTPDSGRRLVSVILASGNLGRPYIAPPGLAPERLKLLRDAFMKAMNDPELQADVKKNQLEVHPTNGEELEKIARDSVNQTPEIIERMNKVLGK
ncbi:MAG: Bug family tripartite tricarboxylate transporter substrate binding protein [Alphaproteobacteria bacterium]